MRSGLFLLGVSLALTVRGEPPADKAAADAKPAVVMDAFKVDAGYMPKLSFGISLDVTRDNDTQMVRSIHIGQVRPGSEAARKGLRPLARVDRINGKPVEDIVASFLKGTELNDLFVDRANGDRVTLEFWVPGERETRIVTLTEQRSIPGFYQPGT